MSLVIEVFEIVLRSIIISGTATLLAVLWSIPVSLTLLISESKTSGVLQDLFNSLVSVPTVLLGLLLYMALSRSGPLGFTGILYTPLAISIGEALLITPLMISVTTTSLKKIKDRVWETAMALGATKFQASQVLLREGLPQVVRSILIGFNRAIGELGIALMVGGNIRGYTRVMTTAIALEVIKGDFELAINLGMVFLLITASLTILVGVLGVKE